MDFELQENEIICDERKADWYELEKLFGISMLSRRAGKIYITNFRVIFHGGWNQTVSIDYSNIENIVNVGIGPCIFSLMIPIWPIGVDFILKNGEQHRIALQFKRDEFLKLIEKERKNA